MKKSRLVKAVDISVNGTGGMCDHNNVKIIKCFELFNCGSIDRSSGCTRNPDTCKYRWIQNKKYIVDYPECSLCVRLGKKYDIRI